MGRVFLDTDICIDFLSYREQFFEKSNELITFCDENNFSRIISESCLPNLIYVLTQTYKLKTVDKVLIKWIDGIELIGSSKEIILRALHSPFKDKEDAYQ